MPIAADCVSQADKDIRLDAASRVTFLELHQWLSALAPDETASSNAFLDITKTYSVKTKVLVCL